VVVTAALERTKIDPSEIDDLILAEGLQGGGVIARHTAVTLGLDGVPGLATNRHCATSLGPGPDRSLPARPGSSTPTSTPGAA
jgi:acetyl-CoA acetyltransferase